MSNIIVFKCEKKAGWKGVFFFLPILALRPGKLNVQNVQLMSQTKLLLKYATDKYHLKIPPPHSEDFLRGLVSCYLLPIAH